jgi:DNA-binding NarL/FixJ family response regulator
VPDPAVSGADGEHRVALLVSAEVGCIAHVRQILTGDPSLTLEHVVGIEKALAEMRLHEVEVLLVDLAQLGSDRFAWLAPVQHAEVSVPLVLLSDRDDDDEASRALSDGAQA